MADATENFGLERLIPGEGLTREFLFDNPTIIDRLLMLGAVTHRHNAAPPVANPTDIPVVVLDEDGGTIPADVTLYIGYTWVDQNGGETALSEPELVTTPGGQDAPALAPELVEVDTTAGTLLPQTYRYALTVVSDSGAESMLGPVLSVNVDPGSSTNSISLTGLLDAADEVGAATWRLWRSVGGGAWGMVNQGTTNDLLDDGSFCIDCDVAPPTTVNTAASNLLRVTVPGPAPAGVATINIYGSVDGSFDSPALLVSLPFSAVNVEQVFTSVAFADGSPPDVNMSVPGAAKIDPDTELVDYPWKRPVATFAALPATGNTTNDIRLVVATGSLYRWDGDSWEIVTGLPGHVIQDEGADRNQRAKLNFTGAGVTVTDDAGSGKTVVTIPGGGGGGGGTVLPLDGEVQWTDTDDVVRAAIRAHRTWYNGNQEDSDWWMEEFDGAAGFVGAYTKKDGSGFLIPDNTGNDREAYTDIDQNVYGPKIYASRAYDILSDNWHRLGIGLGFYKPPSYAGVIGFFVYIDRDLGELQIRVKRDTVGNTTSGGVPGDEAEYEIINRLTSVDGYAAPAIGDNGNLDIQKEGNTITVTDYRDDGTGTFNLEGQLDAEVPTDMLTVFPETVTLRGFLVDWWDAAGAWQTDNAYVVKYDPRLQLEFGFKPDSSAMTWYPFADQVGDGTHYPPPISAPLALEADWTADTNEGTPTVYTDQGGNLTLSSGVEKLTGTAPVDGELIGTLPDPNHAPYYDRLIQVVTGDDDGVELGIIQIIGYSHGGADDMKVFWRSGRSSTPATKSPFVRFDGVKIS